MIEAKFNFVQIILNQKLYLEVYATGDDIIKIKCCINIRARLVLMFSVNIKTLGEKKCFRVVDTHTMER